MDNLISQSAAIRLSGQRDIPPGFQIHRQQGNAAMLLPTVLIKQMQQEASQQVADEEADEEEAALEACIPEPAPVGTTPLVPVFNRESIDRATKTVKADGDEKSGQILPTLEDAKRDDGYRHALSGNVTLSHIRDHLQNVVSEMPNLALAAEALASELALALSGPPDEFRVTPMLLYGAPGIGKTRFVSQLAAILGVGFDKLSMGAASGAFELCGVSRGWGTTRPGRIAKLLARGESAAPVVLLDEIDKMGSDPRFPVIPTLLDLLEPDSARHFRDECLELEFDASRIIFVATANEIHDIPGPLCSRMRMIEILPPTLEQRFQVVSRIAAGFEERYGVTFSNEILNQIAENRGIDLRGVQQILRQAAGRALIQDRQITNDDLNLPDEIGQRMGFL
ncbi:MAG: AAA family ATPase [Pseudomonadota bacterium]